MYTIKRTKTFEKSFKKTRHAGFSKKNEEILVFVIDVLAAGKTLDKKYKDHQLQGEYKDYRECHVLNDLLLVYTIKEDVLVLVLVDMGTHAQIFG